jgi:hypothetical protein
MTAPPQDKPKAMVAVIAVEGRPTPMGPYTVWSREAVEALASDTVTIHERSDGMLEAWAQIPA